METILPGIVILVMDLQLLNEPRLLTWIPSKTSGTSTTDGRRFLSITPMCPVLVMKNGEGDELLQIVQTPSLIECPVAAVVMDSSYPHIKHVYKVSP